MIKALLPRWTERPKCLFIFFFFICHVLTNCNLIMQASFYTNKKEIYFFNFVPPLSPQLLFLKFYIKKKNSRKGYHYDSLKIVFQVSIWACGPLVKKKKKTYTRYVSNIQPKSNALSLTCCEASRWSASISLHSSKMLSHAIWWQKSNVGCFHGHIDNCSSLFLKTEPKLF